LKFWERNLHPTIARPPILKAPRNFAATGQRGGILLTWRADQEASGYEILRSVSGDFSSDNPDRVILTVAGGQFNSFFDGVSGSGSSVTEKRYYRIRALSNSSEGPHGGHSGGSRISGALSGVVSATSIDPSDTATASSTAYDGADNDPTAAERNRWRAF
jgi:hypothetical protein